MVSDTRVKVIITTTIVVVMIAFAFLLISLFSSNDYPVLISDPLRINESRMPLNTDQLEILFMPLPEEEYTGFISFGAWVGDDFNDDDAGEIPSRLELDSPQHRIHIDFQNSSFESLTKTFLFKPFLNYETVYFKVAGMEDYVTEFIFEVPPGYRAIVPIYLDSSIVLEGVNHALTIAAILFPERFSYQEHEDFPFSLASDWGMMLQYELDYGLMPIILDIEPFSNIMHLDAFTGFFVNQDFSAYREDSKTREGIFYLPPAVLQVAPNEEFELAFTANLHHGYIFEPLIDLLIISLLDWQQVEMSGKPYLLIEMNNSEGYGQFGTFSVTAPSEPGFYEFVSFIVPNPRGRATLYTFFPLERTMRFTIEVIDSE